MTTTDKVLSLCTGHSAGHLLAEWPVHHWGKGCFRAWSAGSLEAPVCRGVET